MNDEERSFVATVWRRGKHGNRMRCYRGRHVLISPRLRDGQLDWYFKLATEARQGPFATPTEAARAAFARLQQLPPPLPIALDDLTEPTGGWPSSPPLRSPREPVTAHHASSRSRRDLAYCIMLDTLAERDRAWKIHALIQAVRDRWSGGGDPPSGATVRRAVHRLIEAGELVHLGGNKRDGYLYGRSSSRTSRGSEGNTVYSGLRRH